MAEAKVPPLASSNRRILPIWTDAALSVLAGIIGSGPLLDTVYYWSAFAGVLLLVSFCNHVLVTVLVGGSVGKLISGLRLVRTSDLRRPAMGQAIHRWAWGFFYIAISPVLFLTNSDIDYLDIAGLRIVRRADLHRGKA